MGELVVLVGLQASGKSSFYRARLAGTHALVSKDLLRSARPKERRQVALIDELLAGGRCVVVDNTNPTVEERERLIAQAHAHAAAAVAYWFPSTVRDALRRNAVRSARAQVPPVAIFATAKRLVPPRREEGFDRLHVVRLRPGGGFAVADMTT